jgi:phage shock protein C
MSIFCQQCGNAMPASARFCSNCGTAIPAAPYIPGRPLERPIVGRQLAGVCLAMARSYGWDVALVRIIAVVGLCVSGGMVGIAYLAGWIAIPEESRTPSVERPPK